jgi:PAS domain S-box-containing protein
MVASLSEALSVSDDARVVTLATSPFLIVHTNKGASTAPMHSATRPSARSAAAPHRLRESRPASPLSDAARAAWATLTGYKFTEVANRTSAILQGPATESESARQLGRACRSGQRAKVRLTNYRKNGEPFVNALEVFPLRNAAGWVTHFCGVLRSAPAPSSLPRRSDWPVAESLPAPRPPTAHAAPPLAEAGASCLPRRPKRRRDEVVRLSDALNNTSDAVLLTEPTPPYRITHVNEPWRVMCGYTQEEVEGETNAILHGPDTDTALLRDLMSSVGRGEPTSATIFNYRKDGERFLNQVQVMPVYGDATDEVEQFMAVLHEVDGV